MDNSQKGVLKALQSRFPRITNLISEKKLLWILAGFLILAGTFTNISSGSAIVIGLGIILIILAIIDPKTIKKLSSKWFSIERHKFSEEEREIAAQAGQKEIPPEIRQRLNQIAEDAKRRKDEERAPEDYMVLAGKALEEKKYEEGLPLAYLGLKLEPKNHRTRSGLYEFLGLFYNNLHSSLLAEKNFHRAIQSDQKNFSPPNNLGNLYTNLNRLEKAEYYLIRALSLGSAIPAIHNNLGALYIKQSKLDDAETAFNKALELDPELEETQENLEKLKKMRGGGEDSPKSPTLDIGKPKTKKFP